MWKMMEEPASLKCSFVPLSAKDYLVPWRAMEITWRMKDLSLLFQALKSDKYKKKYTVQMACCKYACYSALQNILASTAPKRKHWIRWAARLVISVFHFLYNKENFLLPFRCFTIQFYTYKGSQWWGLICCRQLFSRHGYKIYYVLC